MAVDELIRTGEAARALGVSVGLVQRWADTNVLPTAARTPDNWRLFRRSDVQRLVEQRRARQRPAPDGPKAA